MAYLLLALAQLAGLLLIPLGLPGLWLQVGALALFAWWTEFATVGAFAILVVALAALGAELLEVLIGGRFARRYGGARRAEWGAVLGGIAGALVGVPVPLMGSVFGALAGSFLGATALELTTGRGGGAAARVGWGALLGRIAATAVKGGIGVVIAVFTLLVALR